LEKPEEAELKTISAGRALLPKPSVFIKVQSTQVA
jgi:hypothetical protein